MIFRALRAGWRAHLRWHETLNERRFVAGDFAPRCLHCGRSLVEASGGWLCTGCGLTSGPVRDAR